MGNSLCNDSNDINIIDDICILTKQSRTLSIRGTCLYVLGLLSRTQSGMNQLSKYGFGFPADNLECDLSVAVPQDLHEIDSFFVLSTTNYVQSEHLSNTKISCYSPPKLCRPGNVKPLDPNELLGKQGHTEETILAHISSLSNNVTQKSSASALHSIRTKKPSVFTNPLLFRETLKILNTYQFKLAAKRFILFTLFDQVILDQDNASLSLFDHSLDAEILPFKQIREWRYNYHQTLIENKQKQKKLNKALPTKPKLNQPTFVHSQPQQPQKQKQQNKNKKSSVPPPVPVSIKNKYAESYKHKQSITDTMNDQSNNNFHQIRGRQRSDATKQN